LRATAPPYALLRVGPLSIPLERLGAGKLAPPSNIFATQLHPALDGLAITALALLGLVLEPFKRTPLLVQVRFHHVCVSMPGGGGRVGGLPAQSLLVH